MGSCISNNNNIKNDNDNDKKHFRDASMVLGEEDKIIFKLKLANDKLNDKSNKLSSNITEMETLAKSSIKKGDVNTAKLYLAKKIILKKSLKNTHNQQILIDKRILQIKESKSNLELQKVISDSNTCLKEINQKIDNEVYLEAVELLKENEELNNEAMLIIKNDESEINNELNELNKYDTIDVMADIKKSNTKRDNNILNII